MEERLSEKTSSEIKKKIRDMYMLKRETHAQISMYKKILEDADAIIDCCEKELMRRGHI